MNLCFILNLEQVPEILHATILIGWHLHSYNKTHKLNFFSPSFYFSLLLRRCGQLHYCIFLTCSLLTDVELWSLSLITVQPHQVGAELQSSFSSTFFSSFVLERLHLWCVRSRRKTTQMTVCLKKKAFSHQNNHIKKIKLSCWENLLVKKKWSWIIVTLSHEAFMLFGESVAL